MNQKRSTGGYYILDCNGADYQSGGTYQLKKGTYLSLKKILYKKPILVTNIYINTEDDDRYLFEYTPPCYALDIHYLENSIKLGVVSGRHFSLEIFINSNDELTLS